MTASDFGGEVGLVEVCGEPTFDGGTSAEIGSGTLGWVVVVAGLAIFSGATERGVL